jgi:hypothetical protein
MVGKTIVSRMHLSTQKKMNVILISVEELAITSDQHRLNSSKLTLEFHK